MERQWADMLMIIPCVIVYFIASFLVISLCIAAGEADKRDDYLNNCTKVLK